MLKKITINHIHINKIISTIGGKNNVNSFTHCLTRLRFILHEPEKVNIEDLKKLPEVKGCFNQAGQLQIVIGTNVDKYYKAIQQQFDISTGDDDKKAPKIAIKKKTKLWTRLITNLTEIFFPLLPALICGGLLLGLRNVLGEMPIVNNKPLMAFYPTLKPIYDFLWLPCEAIFHFLPVAICWSTVKKIGGTPILGIILGITLVSPQLMNAYNLGSQLPAVWDFGLFTIQKVGYQAQVIPAIFAGLFLGWFEIFIRRYVPGYLKFVIVPIVTLSISVFVAHAILGPIGRIIGNQIAEVVRFVMFGGFASIGSAIFGFTYPLLVISGVHHTTLAIDLQIMQAQGGTPIWPIIALSNIAQASAVVGIIIISRKENEREVTIPAAISAYLGVTEPALYSVNLYYRFPLLCAMVVSAFAGFICGAFGVLSNGIGVGGLPGILSIQPIYWLVYSFATIIAIVVPIILTIVIYRYQQRKGALISD
ncbi:PTS trehalose transporter subunit IIBC [Arsenophonus sp. PmNCSU2021_1]|uniref:PTS trehalose transporter subunit IIBC n=1 Tax=Arsenophonus sp. PmNCSU2021_1 TaxID=3118989 RepID=UPI002FEF03DF